jgi:uncharacterized protein (TIGR03000 family)
MRYSRWAGAALLLAVAALVGTGIGVGRAAGKTTLKVLVPLADAEVKIDGKKVEGEGTQREIPAPDLQKGKKTHLVEVMWEPNNYTKIWRKMAVTPKDGEVVVDLRKKNPLIKDHIEVRYVPTPDDIVEKMCELGKVTKDDVVYDLGCGDGRMVITAIKKYGAKRGVGVDIDPERVKESKENANLHGVEKKVEFRVGDVLKIKDLSDASVVLLYMGNDINNRLKPILKKTLKPGARVVSHRFTMDGWAPTKTEMVTGRDGRQYRLLLWVIGKEKK